MRGGASKKRRRERYEVRNDAAERKGFDLPPGRPGRGSDMPPACHSLPLPFESPYGSIPIKINAPKGTFVFIGGEKGIRTLAWG
jgi:hypothetical protein